MVDLFEEVEEQIRSDFYATHLRRWAPWITGLLALLLLGYLGYWGYRTYQDRNLTKASVAYQAGVDAMMQSNSAAAAGQFQAAAAAGAPGYKALALMQQGNLRLAAGKPQEAAGLYDAAAKAAPSPIFADLASLKAAEALLDVAPFPQLEARLAPLTPAKRPYSVYAKEALATAELMDGRTKQARRDFSLLVLTLGVSDDMRERAQTAVALIDAGESAAAAAAAKIAASLPPPPPQAAPPPDQDQGGAPQPPAGDAQ